MVHQPQAQGAAGPGVGTKRGAARRADQRGGHLPGQRPGRAPLDHPHRDDAPQGATVQIGAPEVILRGPRYRQERRADGRCTSKSVRLYGRGGECSASARQIWTCTRRTTARSTHLAPARHVGLPAAFRCGAWDRHRPRSFTADRVVPSASATMGRWWPEERHRYGLRCSMREQDKLFITPGTRYEGMIVAATTTRT